MRAQRSKSAQSTSHLQHIPYSLSTDHDTVVINCFMRSFVTPVHRIENQVIDNSVLGPLLGVMEPLYSKTTSDSAASSAILAMAWATSAPFPSALDNMHRARKKYIQLISRLQKAVQEPSVATDDATLLAVLLVGLIEVHRSLSPESRGRVRSEILLTFKRQVLTATSRAMPQPGKHINGAMTLINLRGSQNFANPSARKMLSFVKLQFVGQVDKLESKWPC